MEMATNDFKYINIGDPKATLKNEQAAMQVAVNDINKPSDWFRNLLLHPFVAFT